MINQRRTSFDPGAIRLGDLRERVTLQSRSAVTGDFGQLTFSWSNIATVWARVAPMSAMERFVAERLAADGIYEIVIRWRTGIDPTNRILWRGRTLNIKQILNADRRRRFLTLTAEDIQPDAGATPVS